MTRRLVERAMAAELTEHLGYEPHQEPPGGVGNTRNGSTGKTLATEHGPVEIETPRDRNATFEPLPDLRSPSKPLSRKRFAATGRAGRPDQELRG